MKKTIQLLLILAIAFFVVDRLVCLGLEQIDERVFTGQSVGKVNHFLSIKDSVDLLVFGSSRANHHIVNNMLSTSSFNMGVDGTRIGYSAALISTLKKKKQTILVHVDQDRFFNSDYDGSDMLSLINLTKRNDELNWFINDFFFDEIYLSKIINSYIYNGKALGVLKNFVVPGYNYRLYNGYDPLVPSEEQKKVFEKMVKFKSSEDLYDEYLSTDIEINPVIDVFINRIIQSCKKNDARLIFLSSPTLIERNRKIDLTIKKYFESKDVSYYDYSCFFERFNAAYWKDFTHMSEVGANAFSKALKEELTQKKRY